MTDQPQQRNSNAGCSQGARDSKRARLELACGACRNSKKKCTKDCPFAPYFSSDENGQQQFALVQGMFGKTKFLKMLNSVHVDDCHELVASILYEARERVAHPIHGCVFQIRDLKQKLAKKEEELANAMKQNQLMKAGTSYATFLHNTQQQQQQLQQPPQSNINLATQPSYSNNSSFNTNFMNMNSLNPNFGHHVVQTTPLAHNLDPTQFSRLPQHKEENMIPQVFNNDFNLPIQSPYYNNPSLYTNFMNMASSNQSFDQLAAQSSPSLEPLPFSGFAELEEENRITQLLNNETSYFLP